MQAETKSIQKQVEEMKAEIELMENFLEGRVEQDCIVEEQCCSSVLCRAHKAIEEK